MRPLLDQRRRQAWPTPRGSGPSPGLLAGPLPLPCAAGRQPAPRLFRGVFLLAVTLFLRLILLFGFVFFFFLFLVFVLGAGGGDRRVLCSRQRLVLCLQLKQLLHGCAYLILRSPKGEKKMLLNPNPGAPAPTGLHADPNTEVRAEGTGQHWTTLNIRTAENGQTMTHEDRLCKSDRKTVL